MFDVVFLSCVFLALLLCYRIRCGLMNVMKLDMIALKASDGFAASQSDALKEEDYSIDFSVRKKDRQV